MREKYKQFLLRSSGDVKSNFVDESICAESLGIIFQIMQELPKAARNVLHLVYIEGKPYDEIAKELNRSKETIRKQRQLGIIKIRKELANFDNSIFERSRRSQEFLEKPSTDTRIN